jgi:hypothetical protein
MLPAQSAPPIRAKSVPVPRAVRHSVARVVQIGFEAMWRAARQSAGERRAGRSRLKKFGNAIDKFSARGVLFWYKYLANVY